MGDKGGEDVVMLDESVDNKRTKNPRPFGDNGASKKRQKTSIDHTSQPCNVTFIGCTQTFTVPPTAEHKHTIIFLHDTETTPINCANDFFSANIAAGRDLEETLPGVKWIFPSSGRRDSTWFDQQTFNAEPVQPGKPQLQHASICQSLGPLLDLVNAEVDAVGSNCVCLAGIGQGCAMAAITFLTGWHAVECFIGLAGWIPYQAQLEAIIAGSDNVIEAQKQMREFFPSEREGMPHWFGSLGKSAVLLQCADDEVVPAIRSHGLFKVMSDMTMQVQRRTYSMGGHDGVTGSHAVSEVSRFWDFWVMENDVATSRCHREYLLG